MEKNMEFDLNLATRCVFSLRSLVLMDPLGTKMYD